MVLVSMMLCAAFGVAEEVPETVAIHLPQGNRSGVFLTSDELASMRRRALEQEWARALSDGLKKQADTFAAEPLDIPHAEGQWSHWYSCKACGAGLHAESPTKHVCAHCGAEYSGWPYDQVYINRRHRHWLGAVETLGIAYALSPTPAYAQRARDILLEYASFYNDLRLHDTRDGNSRSGARLLAQTLDEAVLFCQVCLGYDLVYDAPCFSPEDHTAIREGLLLPVVETIRRHPAGTSNWQSWHNAAIGCIGMILRDKDLVEAAINGPQGFLFQMRKSVMPSGMWYEESPSYHWYALNAHLYLMEAAARAGVDLYALRVVKGMFDAPARQVLPDHTFAPLQDSDRSSILSHRAFYEVAYARFRDPHYLEFISQRDATWALLWGLDTLPEPPAAAVPGSSNDEGEGLAVLRDRANETVLLLDYGPGHSGHVQPAKLAIVLYAHGDIRLVDPGRLPYGNPMHSEWYRQTVAHNTVVVNRASQRRTHGTLAAFAAGDSYALCRARCDSAYKDPVLLDRTVLLYGNAIVDVFLCCAGTDATFDLPMHFRGGLDGLPEVEPVDTLGDGEGYQHLKNVRRCAGPLNAVRVDAGEERAIEVSFYDDGPIYLAEGHGVGMGEMLPMVLRRVEGQRARFVTVLQVLDAGEAARDVEVERGDAVMVRLGDAELCVSDKTTLTLGGQVVFGKE